MGCDGVTSLTRIVAPTCDASRWSPRWHAGAARKARRGATPSHSYSWMAEPPAAAIFSFADALNACDDTWSFTPPSSPLPSTFTG